MSTYKQMPYKEKPGFLSSHPLEKLITKIWERRITIARYLAGALVVGISIGGFQYYQDLSEKWASQALSEKNWSEADVVLEKYPKSDAAVIAKLAIGDKAIADKEWDKAISIYEELTTLPPRQSVFRIAAFQNLAFVYRQKKDLDKALEWLRRAERDQGNKTVDYSKFLVAQVLDEKGEKDEALKIYTDLARESSLSEVRAESQKKVGPKDKEKK